MRHADRRAKTVEAGIWRQRQTPTGYHVRRARRPRRPLSAARARRLVPSDRAGDVLAAFEAAAAGEPITQIGRALGMTYGGRAGAARQPRLSRRAARRRPLQHDGTISPLHVNPAAHDAIVPVELFDRVQRRLAGAVRRAARDRAPSPRCSPGLIRCASCSHAMSRRMTKALGYGCHREHSQRPVPGARVDHARRRSTPTSSGSCASVAEVVGRPRRRP